MANNKHKKLNHLNGQTMTRIKYMNTGFIELKVGQ